MFVMLRRFWIQLTADRKRFGLLCLAVAVLLLFWARLIIISNAPRTVMAEDPKPVMQAGQEESKQSIPKADNFSASPMKVALDRVPARDPFVISVQHFPRPEPVVTLVPEAGKSGPETVEDPSQAALRREIELRSLVDRFTLDACMSQPPLAVIGGKTYRPGDEVPGIDNAQIRFKLVEVRQGMVLLECEDRQYELKMESPGL